jgi:tetratricopeptide (TPR) repeat protein
MTTQPSDPIIARADLLYAKGCCDEAVGLLTDHLARHPAQDEVAIRLVEFLVDSGLYTRALEILNNAVSNEISPRALLLRGHCHEALGDFPRAENVADRLIAQERLRPDALALKSRIAAGSQKNEIAERLLQEAIACGPGCGMAWHGRASLRRKQGDARAYFESARKAFLCSPESRDIAIAFHESSVAVQEIPQAETDLREALLHHPMNRRLRFFLIDLMLRQAKFAEAMTEIESALVDFGVDKGMLAAALSIRARLGPISIPGNSKPGGSVSLCMIVKNEIRHLARCLRSAKPVVDEMIVVDTGSNDETKDIARVFGALVYEFSWSNDFSKARNFSLSQASGDWILVLDADEALSEKDFENFKRVLGASQNRPVAYRIQTRNYTNQANAVGFRSNRGEYPEEEGLGWHPTDKVRLFTNDPRIRFAYPVHELVEPSLQKLKTTIRDCPVAVHHYGTLSDKNTLEKTKIYQKLGREKVRLDSKSPAALKELAVETAQIGHFCEALNIWQQFVKLQPRSPEAYLNMGAICWNLERYSDAISYSEKALKLDPFLKEARFNMAYSMLLLGRAEEARTNLAMLVGEQTDYPAAQFLMCAANVCLQEATLAKENLEKLEALPIGKLIGESFLEISKRLLSASRTDYACRTLEAALCLGCTNPDMKALFEKCWAAA